MTFKELLEKSKGTYAAVRYSDESIKKLEKVVKELPNPNYDFHTTLLYSRKYLPNYKPLGKIQETATVNGFKIFDTQDEKRALVLTLDCPFLVNRHNELMKEHGATYDYDEYIPHITLSYDLEDRQIEKINFNEVLEIVLEYSEDLKLDWKPND